MSRIFLGGIGSLGSWLLRALIFRDELENIGLTVMDYDKVEKRNIGNQIYTVGQVGMYKTQAMAQSLLDWDMRHVFNRIEFLTGRADSHLQMSDETKLIIDCFDNFESRLVLQDIGDDKSIPVLHFGFSLVSDRPIARGTVNDLSDFESAGGQSDVCDLKEFSGFFQGVGAIFANATVDYLIHGRPFNLVIGFDLSVKNI